MRQDLTDITLVIDRSGSMAEIQDDAQGGINTFIEEQKNKEGEALLTIIEFDDQYEVVYNGESIKKVGPYKLVPRGWTALFDAIGKAIATTGERLSSMPEADRPGLVVVAVMTDGEENSSKEYSHEQLAEMIRHQREVYSWQFIFLGADMDAKGIAAGMGINVADAATFTKGKIRAAYSAASGKLGRMRGQAAMGQVVSSDYTDKELNDMGAND